MTRYGDKYRIETTRWKGWDYCSDACYFVTICTRNREHFLGEVVSGEVRLSDIGEIAERFWVEIPNHFRHVLIDVHVVMPNHLHGILLISHDGEAITQPEVVEARHVASLQNERHNRFGPLAGGSLQAVVHSYKASVTRWCHRNRHPEFAWQARFYDHIIRTEDALDRIRQYVLGNAAGWDTDAENVSETSWLTDSLSTRLDRRESPHDSGA